MSAPPPGSLRHRGGKKKHGNGPGDGLAAVDTDTFISSNAKGEFQPTNKSEWDYRITCALITVVAFVTRFWNINHPNQVVFDEVHFGKVRSSYNELSPEVNLTTTTSLLPTTSSEPTSSMSTHLLANFCSPSWVGL